MSMILARFLSGLLLFALICRKQARADQLRSRLSGKCALVPQISNDNNVTLSNETCSYGDHFQFDVIPAGDEGYFQIMFRHSGKCAGVAEGSPDDGALVVQETCEENLESQMWKVNVEDSLKQLVVKHSNKCLNAADDGFENCTALEQRECVPGLKSNYWVIDVGPPSQPSPEMLFWIISHASTECAEMSKANKTSGVGLSQWKCADHDHFLFEVIPTGGEGYYQIKFSHSGKCIDVQDGSELEGASLVQETCQEGIDSQLWKIQGPTGVRRLVAKHSGMCMNAMLDDKPIVQRSCLGNVPGNIWSFSGRRSIDRVGYLSGSYFQIRSTASNMCAEMSYANKTNGVGLSQWKCINSGHFQFEIISIGDEGYHQIRFRHSGKCIDVQDRSTMEGARLVQETCLEVLDSQLWKVRGPTGKRQLVAKHSGLCMTIDSDKLFAPVVQLSCSNNVGSYWSFNKLGSVSISSQSSPTPFLSTIAKWNGPYPMTIVAVAAANLPDGRILSWASYSQMNYEKKDKKLTWVATFDPATNRSSEALIKNTNHNMFCPGTAVLPDGRIAITGGSTSHPLTLYNPDKDTWTRGSDMIIPRGYHSMTMLANGTVFTLGGSWSGEIGGKDGEVWDPKTNSWELKSNVKAYGSLITDDKEGIYRGDNQMWLFTAPNGKVFHAGPAKWSHWITTEGKGSVTKAALRDSVDAMNGNAVMFDIGKILTSGGSPDYTSSRATNRAHVIDLNQGDEVIVKRVGDLHNSRAYHNSIALPSGEVLVVGGQRYAKIFTDTTAVLEAEIWNPTTEKFTELPAMITPRTYHSVAILMKDGRVWVGGGGLCGKCKTNHLDAEILTPPYLLDETGALAERPIIRSASTSAHVGDTISVRMDKNATHTFALVRLSAVTHSTNNDGRRFPLAVLDQADETYELKIPDNKAIALAGSYFLFAMNWSGVPSVARILKIDVPVDMPDLPEVRRRRLRRYPSSE